MASRGMAVTPSPVNESGKSTIIDNEIAWLSKDMQMIMGFLPTMLQQEDGLYRPRCNFLRYGAPVRSHHHHKNVDAVNEAWRRKLCEWMFEVVDHFQYDREVVLFAMNYLDRFAAINTRQYEPPISKRYFQLIAVAALYIAIKLHGQAGEEEDAKKKIMIGEFVDLTRGSFQAKKIEAMEQQILFELDFRLNPPTAVQFLFYFLRLLPQWSPSSVDEQTCKTVKDQIFDQAKYLIELSICVSSFTFHSKPSIVAYASILCAIEMIHDAYPVPYEIRVQFLKNVTIAASSLLPTSADVLCVQGKLKELCPDIFKLPAAALPPVAHAPTQHDDEGYTSPICVSQVVEDSKSSQRKRIKTEGSSDFSSSARPDAEPKEDPK